MTKNIAYKELARVVALYILLLIGWFTFPVIIKHSPELTNMFTVANIPTVHSGSKEQDKRDLQEMKNKQTLVDNSVQSLNELRTIRVLLEKSQYNMGGSGIGK